MKDQEPLIHTSGLAVGYHSSGKPRHVTIADQVNVSVYAGQLICLLGPNGSGKSTLLRTLAGLQAPLKGQVNIAGTEIRHMKPTQLAREISLVLTDSVKLSNLSVYSLVSLGRYPHSNWLGMLNENDKAIIDRAIAATGIDNFLDRKVSTLSDGECQKVMLARALAQDTPLLMLDEPTAHLDLPSRIQLMRLLLALARRTNKGVLISTHELDLALQVADEVWLFAGDGHLHRGAPEDLVLDGTFEMAFNKEGIVFDKISGTFPMNQEADRNIELEGSGMQAFWTGKALTRIGYTVNTPGFSTATITQTVSATTTQTVSATAPAMSSAKVRVLEIDNRICWVLERAGTTQTHETIGSLLQALKL